MSLYRSVDEVREALALYLDLDELREDIWEYLVEKKHVEDVLLADGPLSALADEYGKLSLLKEAGDGPRRKSARRTNTPDQRSEILSRISARVAGKESQVQYFRKRSLKGELLRFNDVADWVEAQAKKDGPRTVYLKVAVPQGTVVTVEPEGTIPDRPITISRENPAISYSTDLLAFANAGDRGVRRVFVSRDGVLGQLQRISVDLAKRYHWQEALATVFVLTDLPPPLSRAAVELRWQVPFLAGRRIVMEIDPAMAPSEVASLYRESRAEMQTRRYRAMSPKHLQLAEFALANEEGPWRQKMEEWNREFPKWQYDEVSNFSRDCRQATRRILK